MLCPSYFLSNYSRSQDLPNPGSNNKHHRDPCQTAHPYLRLQKPLLLTQRTRARMNTEQLVHLAALKHLAHTATGCLQCQLHPKNTQWSSGKGPEQLGLT